MATTISEISYHLNQFAFWRKLTPEPVYVQIHSWNNTVIVNGYYQLDFVKDLLNYFISVGAVEGIEFNVNYLEGVVQIQIMRPWLLSAYYSIHNKFYYGDPLPSPDDTLKPFSMQVASLLVTKIVPIFGSIEIIFTFSSLSISSISALSAAPSFFTPSNSINKISSASHSSDLSSLVNSVSIT